MFLAIVVFLVSALREGRIPRKFPFSTIRQTPESQKLGFDVFAWPAVWPLPRSQTIFWSEGTEKGRCPDAGQRGELVVFVFLSESFPFPFRKRYASYAGDFFKLPDMYVGDFWLHPLSLMEAADLSTCQVPSASWTARQAGAVSFKIQE